MAKQLSYRLYRDADFPAVARLWADEAGWGEMTPETWRQWFEDTPYGPCLVVVAVEGTDQVVGQLVFTPTVLQLRDREVRGLRLSAPIIRAEFRTTAMRSISHPAIMMWLTGSIAAAARGHEVVYAQPEFAWLPFFRAVGRFRAAEYRCLAAPPEPPPATAARGLSCRRVPRLGPEHQAAWESARARFPIRCGVKRTPDWLAYRHGAHTTVEVRESPSDPVMGYVAINSKTGLVVDVVARGPEELTPVLAASHRFLAEQAGQAAGGIKVMETPALAPALRELNFAAIDFRFGFVTDVLNPDLDPADLAPEAWYAVPSD